MKKRHYLGVLTVFLFVVGLMAQPAGAAYPEKAIELVIHMAAGSAPDIEGRVFATELSKVLGKPVVPINKPGGGGAVSYTYVYNAKPDGYTLAWNSMSILTCTNIGNVPYDFDALEHVGQIMTQPMLLAVRGDAKWKTAKDLIADAKAHPGTIKMASAAIGSSTHLVTLALQQYAGIDTIVVPLGAVRMLAGLLAGEVDTNSTVSSMIIDMVKAKKVRVLMNTGEERMSTYPDAPTMKELGYDVVLDLFRGVSVPKGTPPEIKAKLYDAMMKVAKTKAMKNLSAKTGLEIKMRNGADFTKYLYERDKQIKEILKKAGLYRSKAKKK
jgi:tripartite-type tricarboxylate transporter receptor subunit TctC